MSTAALSLIIFGICIILFVWDKLPMATTAIMGCTAMVFFGVCDFKTAFGQFSSDTVLMLIGVLVVGNAVAETGMATKIGNIMFSFSTSNERLIIVISFLFAMLLSTFLTNITVLAIFIPIIFSISRNNKRINPLNVIIPLTLAVNIGGITTLVGSSQQMTTQGLLEEYGYAGFNVFDFTPFGLVLGAVTLTYVFFVGYPLGKCIWGNRQSVYDYESSEPIDVKAPHKKTVIMTVIFVIMIFFYITRKIPFINIEIPPHLTSTMAALACIATGCISQKRAIEMINWNIVGRLAACLGLSKAVEAAGGIDLIANTFMKISGKGISPMMLFVIFVVLSQLLSLFTSNSTAISVVLLVVISITPKLNLNLPAFAMGITLASSMGASCPLSGSTWGISMVAGYQFRDYLKYGIMIDALSIIVIIIMVPQLMKLTV